MPWANIFFESETMGEFEASLEKKKKKPESGFVTSISEFLFYITV